VAARYPVEDRLRIVAERGEGDALLDHRSASVLACARLVSS
jgi:hypothetical protein